jgi:streptogramin lyase
MTPPARSYLTSALLVATALAAGCPTRKVYDGDGGTSGATGGTSGVAGAAAHGGIGDGAGTSPAGSGGIGLGDTVGTGGAVAGSAGSGGPVAVGGTGGKHAAGGVGGSTAAASGTDAGSGGIATGGTVGTGGTPATGGSAGSGSTSSGGASGIGGSATPAGGMSGSAGSGCAIPCAANAYCANGTCQSRTTEYQLPSTGGRGAYLTTGPDGNIWFTAGKVGRFTVSTERVTVFDLTPPGPMGSSMPQATTRITSGPDSRLWFPLTSADGQPYVGAITPSGVLSAYQLTSAQGMSVGGISAGPDGDLWISTWLASDDYVFRVTTTGSATYRVLPTSYARPFGIIAGPDGNVWTVEQADNIAEINTSTLSITELPIPNSGAISPNVALGPDGQFWFTEQVNNSIGRVSTTGAYSRYQVTGTPTDICVGSDGNLWFISFDTSTNTSYLGRMTVSGGVTEFSVPQQGVGITSGPDGNIWFMYQLPATLARFVIP